MTDGEIIFHLREVLAHWTAPRITTNTAGELERLGLVEFSEERRFVRLTPQGVQRKIASRRRSEDFTIGSIPRRQRRQEKKKQFRAPRGLV